MLAELIEQDTSIMPYVRFERVAVEDPKATLAAGHYVAKDIDRAYVTPPYSKDVMIFKVENWLNQLSVDASQGRIPKDWVEKYKRAYEAWKQGQELPLDGFPIKGWGVCSPAQQETLIRLHILTVEQLAAVNDEGIRRIGMGAVDLKNKADAWLKQLNKAGKPTVEMAALKKENASLKSQVENLEEKLAKLAALVEAQTSAMSAPVYQPMTDAITADDLMGDE